jgi:PhnB protein
MRAEPYLFLQGRCQEALDFYRTAVGAEVQMVVRFGDMPNAPPGAENNVMHAVIRIGDTTVMASDGQGAGPAQFHGFSLSLAADTDAEAERLFAALAQGGEVRMPLMPTPFASRMGMLADRFGVPWMVVCQQPTSA